MNALPLRTPEVEIIDARELARRWAVPEGWIRRHSWDCQSDPIPHVKLGKWVRYEWNSAALGRWFSERRKVKK